MEEKKIDNIINEILNPYFDYSFGEVSASHEHMRYFILGMLSLFAIEGGKVGNLKPSICIRDCNEVPVFNDVINVCSIPKNFHTKINLVPLYQFDFVYENNLDDILLCFKKEGTGRFMKHNILTFPLYKMFSEMTLLDFYDFMDADIVNLKKELSEKPNNIVCVSVRVHFYNPKKRAWEIVFID